MHFLLKLAHDVGAQSLQKSEFDLKAHCDEEFRVHSLFIAVCVITDAVWPHSWLIINQVLQSPKSESHWMKLNVKGESPTVAKWALVGNQIDFSSIIIIR